MAKKALADVLWEAANLRLWDGRSEYHAAPLGRWRFSCDAATARDDLAPETRVVVKKFLARLGCDTEGLYLFTEFPEGRARQGARYLWLLLAMHVAEDEGIEIEVEA